MGETGSKETGDHRSEQVTELFKALGPRAGRECR